MGGSVEGFLRHPTADLRCWEGYSVMYEAKNRLEICALALGREYRQWYEGLNLSDYSRRLNKRETFLLIVVRQSARFYATPL